MVFMGQAEPLEINLDVLQQRLDRPDYAAVAGSLREIGFASSLDLLSTYAGQRSDLAPWLEGAEVNRDRNLRLQYLAGLGINSNLADYIYREILSYRRSPVNLFSGSLGRVQALLYALSLGFSEGQQQ
jgi:spermidine synthase